MNRRIAGFGFLVLLSFYLAYYLFMLEIGIFCVNLGEFGELIWCSSPAGTYFPFPEESGYLSEIISSYSLVDYLIYVIFISNSFIYEFTLLTWIMSALLGYEYAFKDKLTLKG